MALGISKQYGAFPSPFDIPADFQGLGWSLAYFFHTATIVIYNIQWHSQKIRIKTCSHLFSTVPQPLNPYVCTTPMFARRFHIVLFLSLFVFFVSGCLGFLFALFGSHRLSFFFKFLVQSCRLMSNGTCMEDVFLGRLNIWFQIFPEALEP